MVCSAGTTTPNVERPDVSAWVAWSATQIGAACATPSAVIDQTLHKTRFCARHAGVSLNKRERNVLQRLLGDGDGGLLGRLNAEKYVNMTGASKATATRDLASMLSAGLLWTTGQGKGLRYFVSMPGWSHGVAASERPGI